PAPAAAAPAAAPSPATAGACLEWGSFTIADAPRMEKALEPLALGGRLAQRPTQETAGWWVFMPPQGSRQAALRKAAELKNLGVEEFFVLTDEGQYRWSVSLGVFRTEEAARARLAALRTQGVRTAQVGPREMTVPKVWLQVSGVDAALEARLKALAAEVEGSELKPCP
ncbi:MAG TPA: SPOR domain-containing protein, partial [Burkholderiales bacterium]